MNFTLEHHPQRRHMSQGSLMGSSVKALIMSQMPSKQTNNILNAVILAQGQAGIGVICCIINVTFLSNRYLRVKPRSSGRMVCNWALRWKKTANHCCNSHCHFASVRQKCQSLRLFIGPQQGHCSAVSSSILGDWWTRPCPGLKGTLSPPMKREISTPCIAHLPHKEREVNSSTHFYIFSLLGCPTRLDVYASNFLLVRVWCSFLSRCWWWDQLPVIDIYLRGGKLSLKKHFYTATVTEQGAISRLLD